MDAELQKAITSALQLILLPYQAKWLADRSRYKIGCWSRQTGKSFIVTLEAVLQALTDGNNQILVAASERQALENMEKVHTHLQFLQRAVAIWCKRSGNRPFSLLAPGEKLSKQSVRLFNNARIVALPANPRTIRSFSGDIFWDEAALAQHDKAIYKAILPIATRGGFRVRVTSTPLGDQGIFAERWNKAADSKYWTRHSVTLPEAVDQGLQVDIEAVREGCDEETWEQEYLCRFLSDATSYFPWELLRQAIDGAPELDDNAEFPIWTGIDLGRMRDLTTIIDVLGLSETHLHMREREIMRKVPFEEQDRRIDAAIQRPNVQRAAIDATWNPSTAERARKKHGPIVEGVVFNKDVKSAMVIETKRLMEKGILTIQPGDRDLLMDLHAIRRYVTTSNNIRFDADRTERGHADRAWAGMLAVLMRSQRKIHWQTDFVGADDVAEERIAAAVARAQAKPEQATAEDFWSGLMSGFEAD